MVDISTLTVPIKTALRDYATVAAMKAAEDSVSEGDEVTAAGHRYIVAASGATDHNLTRADGVRLYVQPFAQGMYDFDAWGPAGDNSTDDHALMEAAVNMIPEGGTLVLGQATYRLSAPLELKNRVHLRGHNSGMAGTTAITILHFDDDVTGVVVNRTNTYGAAVNSAGPWGTGKADGSIIEGIKILGGGTTIGTNHGLWMRARARVVNVVVEGFTGDGVHIYATAVGGTDLTTGNANNWYMDNVFSTDNGRHGFYIEGADANAGIGIALDATGNGRCGIYDSSFLGNLYIGCHVAFNGTKSRGKNSSAQSSWISYGGEAYAAHWEATEAELVATEPGTNNDIWFYVGGAAGGEAVTWTADQPEGTFFQAFSYLADNLNARCTFVNCYSEGGAAGWALIGPHTAYNGLQGAAIYKGAHFRVSSTGEIMVNNLSVWDIDFRSGATDAIFQFNHDDDSGTGPWRFQRSNNADWAFINQNSADRRAGGVTGPNTTRGQPYRWFVDKGWILNSRYFTEAAAAPTTGTYSRGDIVYNTAPSAGGTLGWVCVSGGTPGTWKTFGTIEA